MAFEALDDRFPEPGPRRTGRRRRISTGPPDASRIAAPPALGGLRVDVVGSSRELFGSDRSAVRVAQIVSGLGASARLVLPAHRPELGLEAYAASAGVETVAASVAIATSHGLENAQCLARRGAWPGGAPDVVVLNTTAVVAPRLATRTILTVREWMDPTRLAHRALASVQGLRADQVVGISQGVNSQWSQTAARTPAPRLIWNWLDESWLGDADHGSEIAGDILFLGRFNAWKGQEVLADAYDTAFGHMPVARRPRLTFLGAEGEGSPFAGQAEALRRRASGQPWAVVPATASPRGVLASHRLLVVPSLRPEPFGNVLLEGLAAGCRVLAFPGGGPDDLADLFPKVLRVVPRERAALGTALSAWWSTGGEVQSEGERARTLATLRTRFTADRARADWASAVLSAVS